MDWIPLEGGFTPHDFTTFDYEDLYEVLQTQRRSRTFLITKTVNAQLPVKQPLDESRYAHDDGKHHQEYILDEKGSLSFKKEPIPRSFSALTDNLAMPGFHLIILPRVPEVRGQASSVSELPFSEDFWRTITKEFHVHRTITRTILREVAYFSALRHTPRNSGVEEISYTARMAAAVANDLALSTAYIPSTNTTYAILYGCNEDQTGEIWTRISTIASSSPHGIHHPLLTMGIFIELERTRLVNQADKLALEFTLGSDILENPKINSWDATSGANSPKMESYLKICLRSRTLVDYIRAVKRQLVKVLAEIDELERGWSKPSPTTSTTTPPSHDTGTGHVNCSISRCTTFGSGTGQDEASAVLDSKRDQEKQQQQKQEQAKDLQEALIGTGRQMKQRIRDIIDEYDDKIDECKKMAQNLSLAMQTGWNQIARQESITSTRISHINTEIAWEAKREGAQMRSIAVVTMIYLPLSSVASVFSTSLFNWSPNAGESVVSQYIWILAVLAIGLTILTVLAWHLWTRREKKHEEVKRRAGLGLDGAERAV